MKMKFLITILLLVCVIVCVFGLAACNGGNNNNGNNTDKSFQNAEFVSYRKKIVTIMKDNSIFVNDLDANQNVKTRNQNTAVKTAAASTVAFNDKTPSVSGIADIMVKQEYFADSDDFDFTIKQTFGITLGMSLCIGDGISNYFNETSFFDIAVKLAADKTYVRVTEAGNVSTIWAYSNNSGVQYEKIDVTYNSVDEYSFKYILINDNYKLYFYGNSDKELLMLEIGQNSSVFYTPDGENFYVANNAPSTANACYDVLGHQIFDYEPTDFSKMETDYKYTFTAEQFKALNDKYFKDIQSSLNPDVPRGIQYEDINGKQVATCYIAEDNETEVVIPLDVKYLSYRFYVDDIKGTVKSIVIPASIQAFLNQDGETVTDYRQIQFTLLNYVTEKEQFFDEITVETGSPLFKAGKGHLTVAENDFIIAIVDHPMDTLDFNVLAAASLHKDDGQICRLYKVNGANKLTIPNNFLEMQEKYGVDFAEALEETIYNTAPDEINALYTANTSLPPLKLRLNKDVIINTFCGNGNIQDNGKSLGISFKLINSSAEKRNVILNVDEKLYGAYIEIGPIQPENIKDDNDPSTWTQPAYVSDDTIFTAVNMPIPEDLYSFLYVNPQIEYKRIVRDEKNSVVNFMPSTQGNKFDNLQVNNKYGDDRASVTIKEDAPENTVINIPENFYEFTVFDVLIPENAVRTKSIKIIVSSNIIIKFENDAAQFSNPKFVLKYNGTFEELKGCFSNYYFYENCDVQFTAECSDKTEIIKIGWKYSDDNEENYPYSASVKYNGETRTIKFKYFGAFSINLLEYWTLQDGYAYYFFDKDGNLRDIEYNSEENTAYVNVYVNAEGTNEFKLYCYPIGLRVYDLKGDNYSLKVTALFSMKEYRLKITEGTVEAYPVFIEKFEEDKDTRPEMDDWEKFNRLQGIDCGLFSEFDLPLQTDGDNTSIRVKFTVNDSGKIEFVICEKISFSVTVTLYDGSKLNYDLKLNSRIPFDAQTWKIEDGYAYYIVSHGNDGDRSYPLQIENGTLYRHSENIELKRIALNENIPVSLSGDNYNVTGSLSLKDGESEYAYILAWNISGTIDGNEFIYKNETATFWNVISGYILLADVSNDYSTQSWSEMLTWTLKTEVDKNGVLSVTGLEYEQYFSFSTSENDIWRVSIENGKATVDDYTVIDDDGMPSADYDDVHDKREVEIRDFTEADLAKALSISREITDNDGNIFTETLYVYLQVTLNPDDRTVSFEYVSCKKEVTTK